MNYRAASGAVSAYGNPPTRLRMSSSYYFVYSRRKRRGVMDENKIKKI